MIVVNNNSVNPCWRLAKINRKTKSDPNLFTRGISGTNLQSDPRKQLRKTTIHIKQKEPYFCSKSEFAEYIRLYKKTSSNISIKSFGSSCSLLKETTPSSIKFCSKNKFKEYIGLFQKASSNISIKGSSLEVFEGITNNFAQTEEDTLFESLKALAKRKYLYNFKSIFDYYTYPFQVYYLNSSVRSDLLKSTKVVDPMQRPSADNNFYSSSIKKGHISKYKQGVIKDPRNILAMPIYEDSNFPNFIQINPRTAKQNKTKFYNRNVIVAPSQRTNDVLPAPFNSKIDKIKKIMSANNDDDFLEEELLNKKEELKVSGYKYFGKSRFSPKQSDKLLFNRLKTNFPQERFNKEENKKVITAVKKLLPESKQVVEKTLRSLINPSTEHLPSKKSIKVMKNQTNLECSSFGINNQAKKSGDEIFKPKTNNNNNIQCFNIKSIHSHKSTRSKKSSSFFPELSFNVNRCNTDQSLPKPTSYAKSEKFHPKESIVVLKHPGKESVKSGPKSKPCNKQNKLDTCLTFSPQPTRNSGKLCTQVFSIHDIESKVDFNDPKYHFCENNKPKSSEGRPKIVQECFVNTNNRKRSSSSKKENKVPVEDSLLKALCSETCPANQPCAVLYAQTIVSYFETFITYEVLKPSKRKPQKLKNIVQDVFVVRT